MKSIGMLALEKKLEQPRFVRNLGKRSYQITRYTRPAAILLPVPPSIDPKLKRINYRMFGSTIGWYLKAIRNIEGYLLLDRDKPIAIVKHWQPEFKPPTAEIIAPSRRELPAVPTVAELQAQR